jgi:hypothetical protein
MISSIYSINRPLKSITVHEILFGEYSMESELRNRKQIEKISELLAFVMVYDRENLIALNTWFDEIRDLARKSSSNQMENMAWAAGKISEELILYDDSVFDLDGRPQSLQVKEIQKYIQNRLIEILSEKLHSCGQLVFAHP